MPLPTSFNPPIVHSAWPEHILSHQHLHRTPAKRLFGFSYHVNSYFNICQFISNSYLYRLYRLYYLPPDFGDYRSKSLAWIMELNVIGAKLHLQTSHICYISIQFSSYLPCEAQKKTCRGIQRSIRWLCLILRHGFLRQAEAVSQRASSKTLVPRQETSIK